MVFGSGWPRARPGPGRGQGLGPVAGPGPGWGRSQASARGLFNGFRVRLAEVGDMGNVSEGFR